MTRDGAYGAGHQRLRRRFAAIIATGAAKCWRCNQPIHPNEPWDLGHADTPGAKVRGVYKGPEHRGCNRSAGAWRRWGVTTPPPAPGRAPARPRPKALEFFDVDQPPSGV